MLWGRAAVERKRFGKRIETKSEQNQNKIETKSKQNRNKIKTKLKQNQNKT